MRLAYHLDLLLDVLLASSRLADADKAVRAKVLLRQFLDLRRHGSGK